MMNMLFIIIFSFFSIGCSNSGKKTNSLEVESPPVSQTQEIFIGYLDLKLNGTLKKEFKSESNNGNDIIVECERWTLGDTSISNILKGMRKVDATEWYALCYNYPCWYEGNVSNGNVKYQMTINAASYVTLSNDKETLHFILEKKSNLFIVACDCCE